MTEELKDRNGTLHREHLASARELIANVVLFRREMIGQLTDRRRNVEAECGHDTEWDAATYQHQYETDPICARVVEVYPKESMQAQFEVYDTDSARRSSRFEQAVLGLAQNMRGSQGPSWYGGGESSVLAEAALNASIVSGIGRYGATLLGFDDLGPDQSFETPVQPAAYPGRRLLYLRHFSEAQARIVDSVTNRGDPRYGMPETYEVDLHDPGAGAEASTQKVHWTRIVHHSEGGLYHLPRMRNVKKRLLDLNKLYGGSAEMYWQGALPAFKIKQGKEGIGLPVDIPQVKDDMEKLMHSLHRWILLTGGLDAESMAPTVVDPTPQIAVQLTAICIVKEVPQRVFMGSEQAQLASEQDSARWDKRLAGWQRNTMTPRYACPIVDRLIWAGCLPVPTGGQYKVWWPDLTQVSPAARAETAKKRAEALGIFAEKGLNIFMTVQQFMVSEMGYTQDEANKFVQEAEADALRRERALADAAPEEPETPPEQTGEEPPDAA